MFVRMQVGVSRIQECVSGREYERVCYDTLRNVLSNSFVPCPPFLSYQWSE